MPDQLPHRYRTLARVSGAASALLIASVALLDAQSLRGSRAAVDRMYNSAHAEGLHFYQTSDGVRRAVASGRLVPLRTSRDYVVNNVRYPYVHPDAKVFVERLAAQYRQACGERLVVTSAVRPQYFQRRLANGSARSVHPTGMAIDLRRPRKARCLSWLRRTLHTLDGAGVITAIEEQRPPHFHVAVYPTPYRQYVAARSRGAAPATASRAAASGRSAAPAARGAAPTRPQSPDRAGAGATHVVRQGETLWSIAGRHGVGVAELRSANTLRSDRIIVGQRLRVPAAAAPSRADARYRVRSGDTLWGIAQRHSVTVDELRRANSIPSNRLVPGQELTIPAR
jgi:LysM repeat protein